MYIVGEEEVEAIAKVIRQGTLFRYGVGGECDRFEARYAQNLGVKHFALTVSGTFALSSAIIALGIVSGYQAVKTGDLARSVMLHVGFNALSVILLFTT